MHAFAFIRPADAAAAVAGAAQGNTAQQGAEVRFVAGGTTLLDLMKLNVDAQFIRLCSELQSAYTNTRKPH